jgi:hypothetical protein
VIAAGIFEGSEQGWATVGLRTAQAELIMVPALGGRVISLRSRRTGRQWCWHQDRPDWLWASRAGGDFGSSCQAGIDECVPTVAACRWRDRALPDHGEVWSQPWRLDGAALGQGILAATVPLKVAPFTFTRAIRADRGGGFVFDYQLHNHGPHDEEWLWSLHPLLTIAPGDRLELPASVRSLRLNGGIADRAIEFGDVWAYPAPFPGSSPTTRLDRLEVPGMPRACVKGFTPPLHQGHAAIDNATAGDRLALRWDPRVIPHLGLWLNRGHAGFHHVALEPTNGAPDSLADAVSRWQRFATIAPGATARWSISWQIA